MGRMTSLATNIAQIRSKTANNKSQFLPYAAELDIGHLASLYRKIRSEAPRRHLKKRQYLFERSGIPSSGKWTNRREEHLAIALYHSFHKPDAMLLPSGQRLEILDYQVPLKAVQSDKGVGKIDMLGLVDGECLAILELKVKGGDTPFAATLEALVYAAILERNLVDIDRELEREGYGMLQLKPPEITVLAPADYWHDFHLYDEAWLQQLAPVLSEIACVLSLKIQFIELEIGRLEMGLSGTRPELDGDVKIKSLFCSKAR